MRGRYFFSSLRRVSFLLLSNHPYRGKFEARCDTPFSAQLFSPGRLHSDKAINKQEKYAFSYLFYGLD